VFVVGLYGYADPYSALQQHPLEPTLYLLLSYHHLHPTSPFPRSAIPTAVTLPASRSEVEPPQSFALEGTSPARTTLLLGLRLLPKSVTLWQEYIKLELGWVEALRRRWKVLGIDNSDGTESVVGGEGSFGPDGEDARKAILRGELVVQALNSALGGIAGDTPEGLAFRQGLIGLLRVYPSQLRERCLEVIYEDLEKVVVGGGRLGAEARLISITRGLYDQKYDQDVAETGGIVKSGLELVEEMGRIGKQIRKAARDGGDFVDVAGEWLSTRINEVEVTSELVCLISFC
jgi:U3 small nucleolar RNA-associated protein 6